MLQEVSSGDKILASQHNDLVRAVQQSTLGQSPDIQYDIGNNTTLNIQKSYSPSLQTDFNTLCQIYSSVGQYHSPYAAYTGYGNADNEFSGLFIDLAGYQQLKYLVYHAAFWNERPIYLFLIDFSAFGTRLINVTNVSSIKWPINWLKDSEETPGGGEVGMGVYQIAGGSTAYMQLATVIIIGNFKCIQSDIDKGYLANQVSMSDIRTSLAATSPQFSDIEQCRLIGSYPLVTNEGKTESNTDFPVVNVSVGQKHIESLPDTQISPGATPSDQEMSEISVCLSSLYFTPTKQLAGDSIESSALPTFSYSIFNFDKHSATYDNIGQLISADQVDGTPPPTDPQTGKPNGLPDFDIVLKHKQKHPRWDEGFEGQTQARVEYLPLSSIISNISVDTETSAQLSSIAWYENNDIRALQLFDFVHPGGIGDVNALSDDLMFVMRDASEPRACVNYASYANILSALQDGLSLSVGVDTQDGMTKSIDWQQQNNVLEIYDFSNTDNVKTLNEVTSSSGSPDVIVRNRDADPNEVNYVDYECFLAQADSVETQGSNCSLEQTDRNDGGRVLYLWDFNNPAPDLFPNGLKCEVTNLSGGDWYFRSDNGDCRQLQADLRWPIRLNDGNGYKLRWDIPKVRLPRIEIPDVQGMQQEINQLSVVVQEISSDVDVISGDLTDLSNSLSNYWKINGTYDDNCYGHSIGDANGNSKVIDLDSKQLTDGNAVRVDWNNGYLVDNANTVLNWPTRTLYGNWTAYQDFYVQGELQVNGNSTLKIGNTTLSEAQLQQLLRLI